MSKLLFISNVSNKITSFATASISVAHSLELEFYQTANWNDAEKTQIAIDEQKYNIKIKNVPISRNPFARTNLAAFKEIVSFIKQEKIEYIHCNTPVGGLIGRLAGKKCKVKKVIYQAHGFHFYKGAPKKNWLLYYPVEKWLARYTDALITINQEDYELAKRKMKLRNNGRVYYVPGVGIDLEKFSKLSVGKAAKRKELGIPEDVVMLLSVGELNANKNHESIIRAIADMDVYYIIAGKGDLQQHLQDVINMLGICNKVKLLGYCKDVKELYEAADIFVFPSFREGLSSSVMEAMASGLPCVVSNIRGNTDLLGGTDGGFLCNPNDVLEYSEKINLLANDSSLREQMGKSNLTTIQKFSTETVINEMRSIYTAEFFDISC